MADSDDLVITPSLRIPRSELEIRATTGGGPGGQHVNRSATRVELWWTPADSPSLDAAQRERLLRKLARRLDQRGRLRIVAGNRRSQSLNREEAVTRFVNVVATALHTPRARKATRPTRASVERRLEAKRQRSSRKRDRRRPERGDE